MSDLAIPDVTSGNAGKRTHRPTKASDLHDPLVEGEGVCMHPGGFLTPGQRKALIGKYQTRVMAAQSAYYAGLGDIGLEESLREDADVDIFTSLALDAISLVAGDALKVAAKVVRGIGGDAKDGDESAVSFAIKGVVDAGKKAAKSQVGKGTEFDREQKAAKSLLDQLGANAALAFQNLREDVPCMLDDADLAMATESWGAEMGHNKVMYAAKLRAFVAQFKGSSASKIGRTDRHEHTSKEDALAGGVVGYMKKAGDDAIRDTKLVLQTFDDGSPSVLMYYMRDYDVPINGGGEHDHAKDLSMFAEGDWKPSHAVEPALAEAAAAQNRAMWGKDYEVKAMPPSSRTGRTSTSGAIPVYPQTRPRHYK